MTLTSGTQIGAYRIVSPLGAGGMGEVYRAHDSKLGRDVAIKVLPGVFLTDPDRLMRFEREARVLAALNHPNIATIHGVEEGPGLAALVMELVEGDTLAQRLRGGDGSAAKSPKAAGALSVIEALGIARQIADALEAAHERSIVHRDLKPANVKITPSGVVKVLDFGLAKYEAAAAGEAGEAGRSGSDGADLTQSPTMTSSGTHAGMILGTASYMSPEQARGKLVDKRADIWAFGCVLYQMLTGRVAFPGETLSDIIAAILEREPDWKALPVTLPPNVVTLLQRCLDKDARRRLRDIGDARIELDDAIARPVVARESSAGAPASGPWWRRLAPAGLAVMGVAGLVFGLWPRPSPADAWVNPLANAQFARFTDFPGTETLAAISPDGKFVAFLSDRDGQFNLWLSQVGTGRFANLTKALPPVAPNYIVAPIGFSGDGSEVSFSQGIRKVLMPLLGGTPRTFLGDRAQHPSWSPDGMQLVYFNAVDGDPMFVADRTGANPRQILTDKPGMHSHNPVWSTDGQWIYYVHGIDGADQMDVWRIRPSGGTPERLTDHHAAVTFLAPLDPNTLLYTAPSEDRSGPWLWALDVTRKVSRRVSSGLEQYTSVAASADGHRVVATVANPSASLWSVPLLDRVGDETEVKSYPVPTVRALGPRFGGTSLFYLSARGTGDGLWRLQDGQVSEVWKGSDGALSDPAAVSPDGRRVAIVLRKSGKRHLTVMSSDGSESRSLETVDVQGAPAWAPDANWIVTGGSDGQGAGLFKLPVDGGAPVRLVKGAATNPVWSPDGMLIVYSGPVVGGQATLLGVRPDGTAVELPPVQVPTSVQQPHRFLPSGKGVVYVQVSFDRSVREFRLMDLATKATRPLARLGTRDEMRTFDITPDGKQIVFDRLRENSDIVLIDLSR